MTSSDKEMTVDTDVMVFYNKDMASYTVAMTSSDKEMTVDTDAMLLYSKEMASYSVAMSHSDKEMNSDTASMTFCYTEMKSERKKIPFHNQGIESFINETGLGVPKQVSSGECLHIRNCAIEAHVS